MNEDLISFEVYKSKVRKQINLPFNKLSYIKLLSVCELLMSERMAKVIAIKLVNDGIEHDKVSSMADNLCLCLFCLSDENLTPLFSNVDELMKNLTNEEIIYVVNEYNLLRKSYLGFDKIDIEGLKKNGIHPLKDYVGV